MFMPPWLGQPADPAAHFQAGFSQGAQIGAQQATQQMQQQRMAMEQQQHAVDMQRRAIEYSMQLQQRREEMAMEKQKLDQAFQLGQEKIAEEAARTAMYEKWHMGELARKKEASDSMAAAQKNFQDAIASGVPMEKALADNIGMFPPGGMAQATIFAGRMSQKPELQQLKTPEGETVNVLSQGGTSKIVPPKKDIKDATLAPKLASYSRDMRLLQDELKKHPGRMAFPEKTYKDNPSLKADRDDYLRKRNALEVMRKEADDLRKAVPQQAQEIDDENFDDGEIDQPGEEVIPIWDPKTKSFK